MASQLLSGSHLLQVLSLINNNFEVLKDVFHSRNRGMAQEDFVALRNTIFNILHTRVGSRVTRFWDANTYHHYILDSRLDPTPDQSIWVQLYGIQYPHLVCQLFLLNDWNLNYSFTMKSKQFENTGLPLWMVHAARKAEPRGPSVATSQSPVHTILPHQQISATDAQQQRSPGGGLFHYPTARGVQKPIYHQDFVGQATSHHNSVGLLFTSKPINPDSKTLLVTRSIAVSKRCPKKAITWPSEEAEQFHSSKAYQPANRLGALDFLPRISKVTPDMLEQTFGHLVMAMCAQAAEELPTPDCRHCSAILSTNMMIARERMMPSKQAEQLRQMAIQRFRRLGHKEMWPTSLVTIHLPELSLEEKMRKIAFQLGAITSRADEEIRNSQVSTSLGHEEQTTLDDTSNRVKDISQQENRRPRAPTEGRTGTIINHTAPSTSRLTGALPRTTTSTTTFGTAIRARRSLPRL